MLATVRTSNPTKYNIHMWQLTQSFSLLQDDSEVKWPSSGKKVTIDLDRNIAQGKNRIKVSEHNSCP
jgi:hypothetical protein